LDTTRETIKKTKKYWFFGTCYAKLIVTKEGTGNREQGTVKRRKKEKREERVLL
jgi:hypothetical protein